MRSISHASPLRVLLILSAAVFLTEAGIMALLSAADWNPRMVGLLDSLMLVILLLPALHFFVLRPLEAHIAERKKAEATLAESKELLERLFSITHALLAYMDKDFNFINVNSAYAAACGRTVDELVGKNHFDLFPNVETERIFRRVVEIGESYSEYGRTLDSPFSASAHGSWWDYWLLPTRDASGQVRGLILGLVDVTDRKKAETALTENEALLRKVMESLPVGVWVLDHEGRVAHANPASADIWGPVENFGLEDYARFRSRRLDTGQALRASEWPAARAILNGETVLNEEVVIEGCDGATKIILESAVPLSGPGGAIVVSEEITEVKKAERRIRQRNRELATLNAISTQTSSLLDTGEIFKCLKELLSEQAGFATGRIFNYNPTTHQLELELSWNDGKDSRCKGTPAEAYPLQSVTSEPTVLPLTDEQVDCLRKTERPNPNCLAGRTGYVWIPLVAHGAIQGLIELANDSSIREADPDRSRYFQAIGQILGVAIHNSRLFAQEQKARETAEVLRQACLELSKTLDMRTVMEGLLDFSARVVPYDMACVTLLEDEEHLTIRAARGCPLSEKVARGERVSLERGKSALIERVIASGHGEIVDRVPSGSPCAPFACETTAQSWLGAPLVFGGKVIGVFGLGKKQPAFYTNDHLLLTEALASQATVAVQNAWLFGQLEGSRERLQTLSRQLVEVQESERGYIARELHDEAGQVLTSLMVGLRLLEREAEDPKAIAAGISRLKGMVDGVLENLHRLAMDLRPASLDHLGLGAALRQLLETIADRNALTAQIETVGLDGRLPKDIEVSLYRIVQEALANVVRHSLATRVDVLLEKRPGKLVAIVEDNGVGFKEEDAFKSCRLGLFGMRERAEMLGGSLTVECGTAGGTTVFVEVPYGN